MADNYTNEPMLDMFIFETTQQIEQLEQFILICEKESHFTQDIINDIFRIMHTIKGSSAMMMFQNISTLAHTMEDIFYFIREEKPKSLSFSVLSDFVLEGIDYIKIELEKIKIGDHTADEAPSLIGTLKEYLSGIKQENNADAINEDSRPGTKQQFFIRQNKAENRIYNFGYKAVIFFEDGCEMENIRAYTIIHHLKEKTEEVFHLPQDIIDNDESVEIIRQNGFQIYLKIDDPYEKVYEFLNQTIFLKDLELIQLENDEEFRQFPKDTPIKAQANPVKIPLVTEAGQAIRPGEEQFERVQKVTGQASQSIISVSVTKLDKLMDLVGEMVISEAMVIQNPDLKGLELDNFHKAARQLNKITSEIQDIVMSVRMVPLSATFQKMNRIVRDMSKKLGKEVKLEIIGEDTEVDKNIIEHISDPLMHLVRNSLDHGIETTEERLAKGKPMEGKVTLEAKNAGSDVLIIVKDDGKGLDKEKILKKARDNGLIYKAEEDMTEKEIFNLILLPGFSTKENVTEFSGRGVGMDVVSKNIDTIGGSLSVESVKGKGTVITLKIPLTLAIIDGMNLKVGSNCYTIPTIAIKESFRPKERDIITDPDNHEMIMVRGQCYPIIRLHKLFSVKTNIVDFEKGIIIMVEQDEKMICVFADELVGQQQVVVKVLPKYIMGFKKIKELAGCTLLGDGSISLILNIGGFMI